MTESTRIVVRKFGGPDVLELETVDLAPPAAGEIQVRNTAIGLNFLDCYQRSGLYPMSLPFVPGNEAAGIVEKVGEGVTAFKPGDRVVSKTPPGAYATLRNLPERNLAHIPNGVSDDVAAAIYLKGLTAFYLLKLTFPVGPGHTIVVSAAAGGVGQILTQWGRSLGAKVIGIAGGPAKCARVRESGCEIVIDSLSDDIVTKVREATGGKGADVVYDSVGKDTFESSLDCLKPRGLMVSFGNSTGPVAVPNLGILASKGSLFVTRPTLAHYFPDAASERAAARELFDAYLVGTFKIRVGQEFALSDVQSAHQAIESRATSGATIIRP
ncbi:MAG: quinone oxidoreductase [Hyphomicrobiaceae bacterium]|nr:quinone oxidoreductase [Hyphomicrobiaceae bacterium]